MKVLIISILCLLFIGIIAQILTIKKSKNIHKKEYFITVPGGSIYAIKYFAERSSNQTPLLIVHGGPGMTHNYLLSLKKIALYRPVIFYDQLGCGKSERPKNNSLWNLPRYIKELICVIEHLQLKKFHLLGHSWGGAIVIEYALQNSPKLKSLILASPYLSTKVWMNDASQLRSLLPDKYKKVLMQNQINNLSEYNEAIIVYYQKHFCRLNPWPKILTSLLDDLNQEAYQTMWGPSDFIMSGNLKDFDRITDLSQISCPILFTCGQYDEAMPSTMEYCLSKSKKGHLKIFNKSSHVAMIEEKENYVNFLHNYLKNLE